jgi:RNA polymerase sigma-70 factor (ECF subfamily)
VSPREDLLPELVRAHWANIWRFLRRLGFEPHVIDDAAQDLFLVVLRRIEEVTPGNERAFLFGAALRIASNLKLKSAREVPTSELEPASDDDGNTTLEERLDDERARALLYRLLSELEENLRSVFVMYELEQMTMHEIADVLEVPHGTVASRLRRARDDFRSRLARHRARTGEGRSK